MKPTRRQLLQWAGAVTAAAWMPGCKTSEDAVAPAASGFFTESERSALAALSNVVIPPGPGPGGADLGAVTYVERLCSAFDAPIPLLFAGGPFSGRRPFPTSTGEPGTTSPPNDFATFLPLDRATERAWRLELYGSAGVSGGGPNDAITGPVIGIREQLKTGLAEVIAANPKPLAELPEAEVASVFAELSVPFRDLLIELVVQAAFSAPEYGGNVGLAGWKLARYEGDSLPLGYSVYSEAGYREAPELPVAGPNPGPDPAAMDEETLVFARAVVGFLGGREVG
ncbi:MAG: hypothetical protein JWP87_4786 [Labilithrix sp.]|nr:hypothetical protein [Labilithrix sp.]